MSEVKRYGAGLNGTAFIGMLELTGPKADTGYVEYQDYKSLEDKLRKVLYAIDEGLVMEDYDLAIQTVQQLYQQVGKRKRDG